LRQAKGLTIKQLHDVTGISTGHLSDIETGKYVPSVIYAKRLAIALETTVDVLFPSTSELTA
jgi:putative transcriptional regulator